MFCRFGSKPMIIITYIVIGIFGTACTFSVNLIMYTILRCTMGFVCFAGFTAAVALSMFNNNKTKLAWLNFFCFTLIISI